MLIFLHIVLFIIVVLLTSLKVSFPFNFRFSYHGDSSVLFQFLLFCTCVDCCSRFHFFALLRCLSLMVIIFRMLIFIIVLLLTSLNLSFPFNSCSSYDGEYTVIFHFLLFCICVDCRCLSHFFALPSLFL